MNEPQMDAVTQRLDRLEREVRWWRTAVVVAAGLLRLVALAAILLLVPVASNAQPLCLPEKLLLREATPAYKFVSTLVDSFGYAKAGADRTQDASRAFQRDFGAARALPKFVAAISAHIHEVKVAGSEYSCAATLMGPFTDSQSKPIQAAAESTRAVYATLVELDQQFIAELVALLDDPGSIQIGSLMSRLSDISIKKAEVWKLLLPTAVMATYALVDLSGRPDEKLSRLSVNATERQKLLQQLEQTFGEPVKQGPKVGHTALLGAGAAIHEFVSNSAWKSLDDK